MQVLYILPSVSSFSGMEPDRQSSKSLHPWTVSIPPISHDLVSFATSESILTDSLVLFAMSYGVPGVYPISSAYTGKWTCPYGELKHS